MRRLSPLLVLVLVATLTACESRPPTPPCPYGQPGRDCIAWPDATNTGPYTALTPSGTIVTSRDGQVIEGLDITGEVRVQHDDVTIRNVRIRSQGGHAIYTLNNERLRVEDCELDGQGVNAEPAIAEHNYSMVRCEVHGFGEGPRINGNVVLAHNFIHDFPDFIAQGAHQDCIQATSGTNVLVHHNVCLMNVDGGNGSIFFSTSAGSNIKIVGNLVGGGNWAIDVDPNQYRDVLIADNRVTTSVWPNGGYFAPFKLGGDVDVRGNLWADGPNAGDPVR